MTEASTSDSQLEEYREAFSLFDRDADGFLANEDLGAFLRALGRNPTEAQVRSLHAASGRHSFPDCLAVLARLPPPDMAALQRDLTAAFRVFDREGQGRIATAELRHIVTSIGEKLTDVEADEMLRQADPEGSGYVDYAKFIQKMLAAA